MRLYLWPRRRVLNVKHITRTVGQLGRIGPGPVGQPGRDWARTGRPEPAAADHATRAPVQPRTERPRPIFFTVANIHTRTRPRRECSPPRMRTPRPALATDRGEPWKRSNVAVQPFSPPLVFSSSFLGFEYRRFSI